ncbi:MAG: hypothetical protein ACYSSJ_03710 [Planctomycetota bacterium]|jgi:hypothetical protein
MAAMANAEEIQADSKDKEDSNLIFNVFDDPDDPQNLLPAGQEREAQKESVFRTSPLQGLHEDTDKTKQDLYDATHLKLGFAINHLFQWLSEAPLARDTWGTATDMDLYGTWELIDRGQPTQGQIYFGLEGRWNYGTTGPETLSTVSLGSLNQTGNTFEAYQPAVILRHLYWQQGTKEAGWVYRVGKINPDSTLGTSAHISANTSFLSTAGVGSFSIAHPDTGLGVAAGRYFSDRVALIGLISDANGDRTDFGDIGEGDVFKAIELDVKIDPRTPKAGYSKITLWHTDGTSNGESSNGQMGPDGWGYFLKYEQELTDDGRAIGIMKYGQSFEDSAFYEHLAGGYFLLYDPTGLGHLKNDLFGAGYSWGQATEDAARGESSVEVFYRFPIYPLVDMTLAYQSIINPALDSDNDHASAFSVRLRTTF